MSPHWRELREAYPRIAKGTVLAIAGLLLIDLVIAGKRVQYGWQLASLRASMTEAESSRVDAIAASAENELLTAAEFMRREALGDDQLHLAVDTEKGILYLERQGARLREMPVVQGQVATVGTPPDTVLLAPPLGKRSVARVVDGTYPWLVPAWVYRDRGLAQPSREPMPGALGPLAIILDSGAILYSRPTVGPLSDERYVLPGSVRAEAPDLEAIRESLEPGMAVYFH
ncbi:MAG TPA: hypothetical protein VI669_03140 [Vicinamibacteria bacterium]